MRAIKSRDTGIELHLRKKLWNSGVRYRIHDKSIFGNPDISIKRYKLAIFCDGEFWHGKNWTESKQKIKSNKKYWYNKIEKNIKRDRLVTRTLRKDGWTVVRLWAKLIQKNPDKCLKRIEKIIKSKVL